MKERETDRECVLEDSLDSEEGFLNEESRKKKEARGKTTMRELNLENP